MAQLNSGRMLGAVGNLFFIAPNGSNMKSADYKDENINLKQILI